MKIIKIILSVFLLIFSISCYSQTLNNVVIEKDSFNYCIENIQEINGMQYKINNNSCETLYLWFEKDVDLPEDKKIKKYFRENRGDISLYQIAMETNISYGCPSLFNTFLKKIEPQDKFSIQIISTETLSEQEKEQIFRYIEEHTVIIKENILEKYIKGLSNFNSLIFYKNDFITLPISLLDF